MPPKQSEIWFFWKIGVAVSPQPLRVGTWNLRESIQDSWKPKRFSRGIWANFAPGQSYDPAKIWKAGPFWENFRKGPVFQGLAGSWPCPGVKLAQMPRGHFLGFHGSWIDWCRFQSQLSMVVEIQLPRFFKKKLRFQIVLGGWPGGPDHWKLGKTGYGGFFFVHLCPKWLFITI